MVSVHDQNSPLDPDLALSLVVENTPAPRPQRVALEKALGFRLLEPITSVVPQPPFSKAMMDGFAVCASDAGKVVERVGEVAAGSIPTTSVKPGCAVEVMTGAPCPPGTEAVVKVEDTKIDGHRISLPQEITAGQHIQAKGLLCQPEQTVLPAGTTVTSVAFATAIAIGAKEAVVPTAPSLTIITTGNELAAPGAVLGPTQIYDSNGSMLEVLARLAGVGQIRRVHAFDSKKSLESVLETADTSDIVVLSGGVSMGRYDLVPDVLVQLGWKVVFHKVKQKPGKPILFAIKGGRLAFGLPGTPLGSHLGFHRYVAAAIRKQLDIPARRTLFQGTLTTPLHSTGARTLFRLARVEPTDNGFDIEPTPWGGSSDLVGPGRSNCYLRLEPGEYDIAAGTVLTFEPVDDFSCTPSS